MVLVKLVACVLSIPDVSNRDQTLSYPQPVSLSGPAEQGKWEPAGFKMNSAQPPFKRVADERPQRMIRINDSCKARRVEYDGEVRYGMREQDTEIRIPEAGNVCKSCFLGDSRLFIKLSCIKITGSSPPMIPCSDTMRSSQHFKHSLPCHTIPYQS